MGKTQKNKRSEEKLITDKITATNLYQKLPIDLVWIRIISLQLSEKIIMIMTSRCGCVIPVLLPISATVSRGALCVIEWCFR